MASNQLEEDNFFDFLMNDDFLNNDHQQQQQQFNDLNLINAKNLNIDGSNNNLEASALQPQLLQPPSAPSTTTTTAGSSAQDNTNVNKKKRKLKSKSENENKNDSSTENINGNKNKKPRKANNQRKNIKKIINEKNLNKSTLQALQEEQQRQQRLQEYQTFNSVEEEKPVLLPDVKNEEFDVKVEETNFQVKDEPEQKPDDYKLDLEQNENNEVDSDDESDTNTDNDIILLDNSIEEFKSNKYNNNNKVESDDVVNTTVNDTDDDCQIISDSEEVVCKPQKQGVHVDDELNVVDPNGDVLINVNHPREDPSIFLAKHLSKRIKPHQIGGIRFLYDNIVESLSRVKNKNYGFGCILAHSMGLGKTFQIVSFSDIFLRYTGLRQVLCIVPINTIQNWYSEFNNWLPENNPNISYKRPFKVFIVNDNCKSFQQRSEVILQWKKQGGVLLIGYEMFRILVTLKACKQRRATSKQAVEDANCIDLEEELKNNNIQGEVREALLTPCLVVCDEGHRIKNNSANIAKTLKCIETKRRIVLTGYPLQNNLIEYWCMVDFVRPSYLGNKAEFCNMFERPIMNGQCVDSTNEDMRIMKYRAHVLHKLLEGFVQRRSHDVFIKTLPPKHEYVILLKLTQIQKELYLAFMESIGAMIIGEKQNPLKAFAICCKIWNHPDVLYDCFQTNKDADNDLDLPELQQQKRGCKGLAQDLLLCDTDPITNEYFQYSERGNSKSYDFKWAARVFEKYKPGRIEYGAKLMAAFTLIEQSIIAGDKILLFSQSLLTLNLIEQFLSKHYLPNTQEKWEKNKNYYRIDGSTNGTEREKLINSFNDKNGNAWLFLLSTRAGCLGINLIGANRVIIFDASFNPCHDAQAVCRVYRYGQQKNSYIYRLIADHTMEKKIYDRQISKQNVSDRVVDEIQSESHFTRTDVEKLIHYVKEDTPPVDLSHIPSKYEDKVLVNCCLKYQELITKEPFKHESLLLDKKEFQLSNKEKRDAFRHYEIEKRIPFNYSRSAYAAAYFSKLNADNSKPNLLNKSPSSSSLAFYPHNSINQPNINHSASFTNTSTPQINNNYYKPINSISNVNNNFQQQNFNNGGYSSAYHAQNSHTNDNSISSSDSSDIQIIDPNSVNQNSNNNITNQKLANSFSKENALINKNPNLKDVSMHRFITTTTITIPTTTTSTYSSPKIIPPGQSVIILKTSKGYYLRTPDGKFYAIRNPSLTSSPSSSTSVSPSHSQATYQNTDNNITSNNCDNNLDTNNTSSNPNNSIDLLQEALNQSSNSYNTDNLLGAPSENERNDYNNQYLVNNTMNSHNSYNNNNILNNNYTNSYLNNNLYGNQINPKNNNDNNTFTPITTNNFNSTSNYFNNLNLNQTINYNTNPNTINSSSLPNTVTSIQNISTTNSINNYVNNYNTNQQTQLQIIDQQQQQQQQSQNDAYKSDSNSIDTSFADNNNFDDLFSNLDVGLAP